jgi:hypothetical protein
MSARQHRSSLFPCRRWNSRALGQRLRPLWVIALGAAYCALGCRDLRTDPGFCAHCPNDAGLRTLDAQSVTGSSEPAANSGAPGTSSAGNAGANVARPRAGAGGMNRSANAGAGGVTGTPNDAGVQSARGGADGASMPDAQPLDARPTDARPPTDASMEVCQPTCSGRTPICLAGSATCVQCAENRLQACTGATPVCDLATHSCVQCTEASQASCRGDTPVCDIATQRCVQCTESHPGACSSQAPVCDTASQTCVQCLDDRAEACIAPTPVCSSQTRTCVQCNPGQSAACPPDASICEPTLHACVQCVDNTDCPTADRARCNRASHACEGCLQDAVCRPFADTPVCDLASGACVACTTATEAERCRGGVCIAASHTCSPNPKNSLGQCAACSADAECASGLLCLPHVTSGRNIGNFCFPQRPANGCADTDPSARPYSSYVSEARSVDGVSVNYCVPQVSCRAVTDAISQKDCLSMGLPDSTRCGDPAVNDGFCNARGKCTYGCENTYDCPSLDLSACSPAPGGVCEAPATP